MANTQYNVHGIVLYRMEFQFIEQSLTQSVVTDE